jgi:membrane-associated protein
VADALGMVTSPAAAYLLIMGLLVLDAFVPVVPTQALMITGGALTVYGGLSLPATIAVGTAGVLVGDWACYLLGRSTHDKSGPLVWLRRRYGDRAVAGPPVSVRRAKARRLAARVTRGLRQPGPLVILLCRFVPGGRMAACFTAGRVRYPYRLFVVYETAAALAWASYGTLVGHIGGTAVTQSAWRLLAVAAVAATVFGTAGWVLALVGRPNPARAASADARPR